MNKGETRFQVVLAGVYLYVCIYKTVNESGKDRSANNTVFDSI